MFDWLSQSWNWAMYFFSQMFLAIRVPLKSEENTDNNNDEVETFKLTYFDVRGLAQGIRDTFKFGDLNYEDKRVTFEEFTNDVKPHAPFGQVPILEVDGDLILAQSKTILRYVSKKARTYPRNHEHAAIIDQWCDVHTDFMNILVVNMYSDRAGLKDTGYDSTKHREWILNNHIPRYLSYLETDLSSGQWLGQMDMISMADFCWYPTLCWLRDGTFDGVTADTLSKYPNILRFMEDVSMQLEDLDDEEDDDEDRTDETGDDAAQKKDA